MDARGRAGPPPGQDDTVINEVSAIIQVVPGVERAPLVYPILRDVTDRAEN